MPEKLCQCCGSAFDPRPQVPNQNYCSKPECQRDRRNRWGQQKMQNDPDYRDNLRRAQRAWHDRNPDYWRAYRNRPPSPESDLSRLETQVITQGDIASPANIDASTGTTKALSGLYWVETLPQQGPGNKGALIIKISPACSDCSCKKDACKYRT